MYIYIPVSACWVNCTSGIKKQTTNYFPLVFTFRNIPFLVCSSLLVGFSLISRARDFLVQWGVSVRVYESTYITFPSILLVMWSFPIIGIVSTHHVWICVCVCVCVFGEGVVNTKLDNDKSIFYDNNTAIINKRYHLLYEIILLLGDAFLNFEYWYTKSHKYLSSFYLILEIYL